MLRFLHYSLSGISSNGRAKARKPKVPKYIYRDELEKKPIINNLRIDAKFEAKPSVEREEDEKNSERKSSSGHIDAKVGIKFKILMKKEEAARLLSKCKDGGVLEFKDVARELIKMPMKRVSLVNPDNSRGCALESIPEEL